MPIYDFLDTKTGKVFEKTMSYDQKVEYLSQNPHIQPTFTKAPNIGDPYHLGRMKPDNEFKDRLKEIKKSHRGSTINV